MRRARRARGHARVHLRIHLRIHLRVSRPRDGPKHHCEDEHSFHRTLLSAKASMRFEYRTLRASYVRNALGPTGFLICAPRAAHLDCPPVPKLPEFGKRRPAAVTSDEWQGTRSAASRRTRVVRHRFARGRRCVAGPCPISFSSCSTTLIGRLRRRLGTLGLLRRGRLALLLLLSILR